MARAIGVATVLVLPGIGGPGAGSAECAMTETDEAIAIVTPDLAAAVRKQGCVCMIEGSGGLVISPEGWKLTEETPAK